MQLDPTRADFVLTVADLVQVVAEKDGRIMDLSIHDRFQGHVNIELTGKLLWYWPDGETEQYVVHSIQWLYRTDGIHRGPNHHVGLSSGDYFLFDNYEGGEPMAYLNAREAYERRV